MAISETDKRSAAAFLDHVKVLYPGGVPLRPAADAKARDVSGLNPHIGYSGSRSPKVVLIQKGREPSQEERQLVQNLVTKGFRLDWAESGCLRLIDSAAAQPSRLREDVQRLLRELNPVCLIVAGEEVFEAIGEGAFKEAKGRWCDILGFPAVATLDFEDVAAKPELKKDLWGDVKGVLARF